MRHADIAFTGTQRGMSENQKIEVARAMRSLLAHYDTVTVHHGCCIGADEEFHSICLQMRHNAKGQQVVKIVLHPPLDFRKEALIEVADAVQMRRRPYLVRNREMVDSCQILIAAPYTKTEVLRSGTWATIRYATRKRKQLIIASR